MTQKLSWKPLCRRRGTPDVSPSCWYTSHSLGSPLLVRRLLLAAGCRGWRTACAGASAAASGLASGAAC